MRRVVSEAGMDVEYAELRDTADWRAGSDQAVANAAEPRAFIAARVDSVRLIDNMALDGTWV